MACPNHADKYEALSCTQTMAASELMRATNALEQAIMHLADLGITDATLGFMVPYVNARITDVQKINVDGMVS